jgi:aspartyl-tRNA(Asn)/glutamyl-tRNA(Gln) amidotransferase subunit C
MSKNMKHDDLVRVASLARIKLTSEEIEKYTKDLNDIIDNAEALKSINIDGVQPMVSPLSTTMPLRADEALPALGQAATLAAASQVKDGHFRVPRTIGEN